MSLFDPLVFAGAIAVVLAILWLVDWYLNPDGVSA